MEIQNENGAKAYSEPFDFGTALIGLRAGKKLQRKGWNGKGMWVEMQRPDEGSKMTLPYLYLNYPPCDETKGVGNPDYPEGSRVPWLASQTDILAEDWQEFPAQ